MGVDFQWSLYYYDPLDLFDYCYSYCTAATFAATTAIAAAAVTAFYTAITTMTKTTPPLLLIQQQLYHLSDQSYHFTFTLLDYHYHSSHTFNYSRY
jgi:hypothetical protein